ncbi:MAG: DEAD/DEAH box helicase family protein [Firmicutes bacterium]|nr:DEAD/DEAH box helicase family protein [Bacillota bacterium]
MLAPKYFLYCAQGPGVPNKIEITSNPRVDAYFLGDAGYLEIYIIQPPQPLWIAERVLAQLAKNAVLLNAPTRLASIKFFKSAVGLLNAYLQAPRFQMDRHDISSLRLSEFDLPELESILWGRSLLLSEIPSLIKSRGLNLPWDPENWLQALYFQGKIQRTAAVSIDELGFPFCRRCGGAQDIVKLDCIFCGSRGCWTCTQCQAMGPAKSCAPLYFSEYPAGILAPAGIQPRLKFELTPPQQRASDTLAGFLATGQTQFLVWAVCGGGKTEVSFRGVAQVLGQGGRVLFAIPRKDIVIELLPRFQEAFPNIETAALYGGGAGRFTDAPLVIATTHQCLRFYHSFDLVVLDEADAFPYQGSAMLHYVVGKALKPSGHLVIMTATPDEALIKKAQSGKIPYISIPARPHRKPLTVPEIVKMDLKLDGRGDGAWKPPEYVADFIVKAKERGRKVLIFLPTIKLIDKIGPVLIRALAVKGVWGAVTHSRAKARDQAKEALVAGRIDFLVTSTILERGITIRDLDVLVLNADYETIFDCRTLIQIAGRAGRLGEPARVLFIGKVKSKAMKEACELIAAMNREGLELGYLDYN